MPGPCCDNCKDNCGAEGKCNCGDNCKCGGDCKCCAKSAADKCDCKTGGKCVCPDGSCSCH